MEKKADFAVFFAQIVETAQKIKINFCFLDHFVYDNKILKLFCEWFIIKLLRENYKPLFLSLGGEIESLRQKSEQRRKSWQPLI